MDSACLKMMVKKNETVVFGEAKDKVASFLLVCCSDMSCKWTDGVM